MLFPQRKFILQKQCLFISCLFGVIFLCTSHLFAQTESYNPAIQKALDLVEKKLETSPQPAPPPTSIEAPTAGIILDILELKDMEIADVLKLISKKSGLNIVAGRDVKGKVTIYLQNVDVRDALRIILESNDLAYVEEEEIVKVMTSREFEAVYGRRFNEKTQMKTTQLRYANASEAMALLVQMKSTLGKVIADDKSNTLVLIDTSDRLTTMEKFLSEIDVPIETRAFELSYSKAEDLSKKIGEVLTKNVGSIKFDTRSNKMIVTDTPQKLDEISKMVKIFDEKHKEVLIEAKIAQVVLSDQFKMGVDWEAIISNYHALKLKSNLNIIGLATDMTSKRGKLSIGTIASDDYEALIDALSTVGVTNILSSPHITAINNEEAKILVGSTQPYITTTVTTPTSGPSITAESVNFIDTGVKLYVTPTIHKDNFITMKIKPEVSSVIEFLTTANNNKIPVVETSQAETTVMVKDNVTIVIGGLMKDEKIETVSKIPLFGDLPLVGFAFRNTDKRVKKTELVIFLTPKIITGDIRSDALEQEAMVPQRAIKDKKKSLTKQ